MFVDTYYGKSMARKDLMTRSVLCDWSAATGCVVSLIKKKDLIRTRCIRVRVRASMMQLRWLAK